MNRIMDVFGILLVGGCLAGCDPRPHALEAGLDSEVVGPEFSASKGLFVPEETRRSLGLKIVEIGEGTLAGSVDFTMRVYEQTGDAARLTGSLPAQQAGALKPGRPVELRTGSGEPFHATVVSVNAGTEKANGSWEVLAEAPGLRAVPGTFVSAAVRLDAVERVATVPRSSVIEAFDGTYVYTVSGEYFIRTAVKLGAAENGLVQVVDGLYAGDAIVAEPVMSLWMTELAAIKGGHSCCAVPPEEK